VRLDSGLAFRGRLGAISVPLEVNPRPKSVAEWAWSIGVIDKTQVCCYRASAPIAIMCLMLSGVLLKTNVFAKQSRAANSRTIPTQTLLITYLEILFRKMYTCNKKKE
jgi:hypothetical protein